MWESMPLSDCDSRLNSFEFTRYSATQMSNFNLISIISTIPSGIMLLIAITDFLRIKGTNIDGLRCDQFFIFWLLVLALPRPFGRIPQWPYCDGYLFMYQEMMEDFGSFGPFLLSLVLSYILHCTQYPSSFGRKLNYIDKNKWNILVGVIILSFLFSFIMCLFYLFGYGAQINSNSPDYYVIDENHGRIKRTLFFHAIMLCVCTWIVWLTIRVCINGQGGYRFNRGRIVGHILGYPFFMIICFTPGGMKKVYDFQTNYADSLLLWQYTYLIMQALYGCFIASWYLCSSKCDPTVCHILTHKCKDAINCNNTRLAPRWDECVYQNNTSSNPNITPLTQVTTNQGNFASNDSIIHNNYSSDYTREHQSYDHSYALQISTHRRHPTIETSDIYTMDNVLVNG